MNLRAVPHHLRLVALREAGTPSPWRERAPRRAGRPAYDHFEAGHPLYDTAGGVSATQQFEADLTQVRDRAWAWRVYTMDDDLTRLLARGLRPTLEQALQDVDEAVARLAAAIGRVPGDRVTSVVHHVCHEVR